MGLVARLSLVALLPGLLNAALITRLALVSLLSRRNPGQHSPLSQMAAMARMRSFLTRSSPLPILLAARIPWLSSIESKV
jgi:hypothetical protein